MSIDNTLFESESAPLPQKKKGGPPNRMNDLTYSVWMKFQKSFIFNQEDETFINESILFFTKSVWPDNKPSTTLIIGFEFYNSSNLSSSRDITHLSSIHKLKDVIDKLREYKTSETYFDYVIIDFRSIVFDRESFLNFSAVKDDFFSNLRSILSPERYCSIVVNQSVSLEDNYPYPWSLALSSRDFLRLRDEKILINKDDNSLTYLLFFQSADDSFSSKVLDINCSKTYQDNSYPTWVIPKSPPRKKNEILHPAKYPETLVTTFIECFTKPGDYVFDPMVGSGSSVIASMGCGRNGIGSDLSEEFLNIAIKRAEATAVPSLFDDTPTFQLFQADATNLVDCQELKNVAGIDYVVTSPPYWSMLNNSGSENQKHRRDKGLKLNYSDSDKDLGNIHDYDEFVSLLKNVYSQVAYFLKKDSVLTVVVKNVKRNHIVYPLAWDLTEALCSKDGNYDFLGTTFWCQDDIGLKPFAVGTHWVSNTLHQYCLHFVRR